MYIHAVKMEEKVDKGLTKLDWCKEAVLQLIEMWQDKECLYNPQHKFYHNKHARYAALNDMADKLKVFNAAIGPNEVKNKITYLRGQYSREMAKAKEKRSGSGADDVHVPCVFWYNEMSFLEEFVKVKKGACNLYVNLNERKQCSIYETGVGNQNCINLAVGEIASRMCVLFLKIRGDTPSSNSAKAEYDILQKILNALGSSKRSSSIPIEVNPRPVSLRSSQL